MKAGRRTFISAIGAGCLTFSATTRARAQSNVRIQAEFNSEVDASLEGHQIEFTSWDGGEVDVSRAYIENGRIELEIPTGNTYGVTFFKEPESGVLESNGVPLLYGLEDEITIEEDTDLGTYEIPEGHLVDIRFEDLDGNPVESLGVGFREPTGSGTGGRDHITNSDGLVKYVGNQETGVELSGTVGVELRDDSPTEVDQLNITESEMFVIPVRDPERYGGVIQSDESDETTETESSGNQLTNESQDTEGTDETQESEELNEAEQTDETERRGFFSNDPDSSFEFLNDPVSLTWVGIGASVLGIITQLIGRQS